MGTGEKIGIAIAAAGVIGDATEAFFPGALGKMTKIKRQTIFALFSALIVVGVLVIFLVPDSSSVPIISNGADCRVMNSRNVTLNCLPYFNAPSRERESSSQDHRGSNGSRIKVYGSPGGSGNGIEIRGHAHLGTLDCYEYIGHGKALSMAENSAMDSLTRLAVNPNKEPDCFKEKR